ncbi:hypothetical protein [Nocardia sp. NPDC051570]|uniref:hypothetical protein n=1 Tax=Nocardia sp. NPDC051570 TaxID=3364324 RepID=UPI0037BA4506
MSFLIRRNVPRAWAGWRDNFNRPAGPITPPWVHLGDGTPAIITADPFLKIPANPWSTNGGGESYQWQPFTPNFGLELDVWYPVEGLAGQTFAAYFTNSWSMIGADWRNVVGVRFLHQPASGPDKIIVNEFENLWTVKNVRAQWNSPVGGFYGQWVTLRVWVENDEWVRAWLNDIYLGSVMISPDFKLGPDRRCVRFFTACLCDVYIRSLNHYDRPASVPPKNVWANQIFADDFERTDGAVGNGWTQIGTNNGIVNGAWSLIAAADGGQGLIRDTGISTGRVRVEATVGQNPDAGGDAESGLVLCSNAAGTQGLSANIFQGHIHVAQYSSSLGDNPPTMTDRDGNGIAVQAGDTIAFSVYNSLAWIEINGVPKLYIGDANGVVPKTNTYAGLRIRCNKGKPSNPWNDVRIFTGLGS